MKNPNNLPKCHTCIYFSHIKDALGSCHLNPPIQLQVPSNRFIQAEETITWETNYCSHHTAKKEA